MKMIHPDIEAAADVLSRQAFNQIWAPRGWVLLDPAAEFANDQLGRFVRSTADLTVDETRALIATKGGDYPEADATGPEVLSTFEDLFSGGTPRPSAPTESATGVPLKLYDPADHNVDEVTAYLAAANEDEQLRVLGSEESGKNRVTITSWTPTEADSDEAAPAAGQEN
jgi:hypothetical protein